MLIAGLTGLRPSEQACCWHCTHGQFVYEKDYHTVSRGTATCIIQRAMGQEVDGRLVNGGGLIYALARLVPLIRIPWICALPPLAQHRCNSPFHVRSLLPPDRPLCWSACPSLVAY